MKRVFTIALFAAFVTSCCSGVVSVEEQIAITPLPESVELGEGTFTIRPSTDIAMRSGGNYDYVAQELNRLVEPIFGKELSVICATTSQEGAINIECDRQMSAEQYCLDIQSDRITITSGSAAGAFYGVQTLRQMIPLEALTSESSVRGFEVAAAQIEDKPTLEYRGAMLDVGRHFFPVDDVKEFIDILALHKINTFHWHLTEDQGWRVEIKKYPNLTEFGSVRKRTLIGKDPGGEGYEKCDFDETPHAGYYTQEQIREIVQYAAERFITIIPEIEFPGHAVAALASYPWLGCTGEQYEVRQTWDIDDRVFCIGKETTFEFVEGVLEEVIELFPSTYIHIGGDECPTKMWDKCPLCQKRMKQEGMTNLRHLQNYATARVEKFLLDRNRKLVGWDEILDGKGITPTAIVMSWRGVDGGIKAAKSGNYAIMAPTTNCYFDYYQSEDKDSEPLAWGGFLPVEKVYEMNPYEGLTTDEQRYILGVQGNVWTEYISNSDHMQYMLLPRLAALSEVAWSLNRKDYDDFLERAQRLSKIYDVNGYNYAKHIFEEDDKQ